MASDSLAAMLKSAKDAQLTSNVHCPVKKALEKLPPADRGALAEAMSDPVIYGTTISKVLRSKGFEISSPAIQRHRRGVCTCPAGSHG
jgi:hypothetical protein